MLASLRALCGLPARLAREFDDWRQVTLLRVVVPAILALVSFYYLFQWAVANAIPPWLAWTLPAALDVTAYMAVKVARRARDGHARFNAGTLAWACVLLSVAGNIGAHALGVKGPIEAIGVGSDGLARLAAGPPMLTVSFWTIAATAAVYPVMLIWGHVVAAGMEPRPLTTAQQDAIAQAAQAARDAERAALEAERATRKTARKQACPAGATVVAQEPPAPAAQLVAQPPTAAPAQVSLVKDDPAPAVAQDDDADKWVRPDRTGDQARDAVAFVRANPGVGRRPMARYLGISDYASKDVHKAAKREVELGDTAPQPHVVPAVA